jgi:transposase
MYYIGLDVHKKTIGFCVKDAAGQVHREGKIGSTRRELDAWIGTLPQPHTIAMEATIFTGWTYDHLLPHASAVKVAHPLMLRAIAAAKKKNDRIDAGKIADCLRCDFLPECHMASTEIRDRRRVLRYRHLLVKQMVQTKNRVPAPNALLGLTRPPIRSGEQAQSWPSNQVPSNIPSATNDVQRQRAFGSGNPAPSATTGGPLFPLVRDEGAASR